MNNSRKVRYRFVREKIAELFQRHSDLVVLPIDVRAISNRLGIRIVEQSLEDHLDAAAIKNQGQMTILLNNSRSSTRKRFSIAHELGHLLLHTDPLSVDVTIYNRDPRSATGSDLKEIEANFFAASLLMPEPIVRRCLNDQAIECPSEEDILMLSRRFQVSSHSMTIRLQTLGILHSNY